MIFRSARFFCFWEFGKGKSSQLLSRLAIFTVVLRLAGGTFCDAPNPGLILVAYSDIRLGEVTQVVGVDARTGKLPENAPEGPNAD
jgi:hypothetical protein